MNYEYALGGNSNLQSSSSRKIKPYDFQDSVLECMIEHRMYVCKYVRKISQALINFGDAKAGSWREIGNPKWQRKKATNCQSKERVGPHVSVY
jgi:hypothetical protein